MSFLPPYLVVPWIPLIYKSSRKGSQNEPFSELPQAALAELHLICVGLNSSLCLETFIWTDIATLK